MKQLVLFFTVFVYSIACCQDIPAGKVPSVVINTLKAKFTNVTGLDWEKKGTLYEADFNVNNIDHKALLNARGELVKFKQDIRPGDLPDVVIREIHSKYTAFTIEDAEKIEKDGRIFYQVELDGRPHDKKLVFSADGKIDDNQRYW